jgi:hypothetical protein
MEMSNIYKCARFWRSRPLEINSFPSGISKAK